MCELEYGCEYKPLSPIEKRNELRYKNVRVMNKPCCINPDMCWCFREMRKEKRYNAAFSDGQMDLSLHFVYKSFRFTPPFGNVV